MSIAKAVLGKIHIAKQQLGLEDDIYRAVLARVAGVRSAKELSDRQAGAVLAEFERLGWKPKQSSKAKGKPHNFVRLPEEVRVIEAQLADMGLSWAYADAIAKRMYGVPRVAWLKTPDKYRAILAALHVEQEKRSLLDQVEALCKQLELESPEQLPGLDVLPVGWQRRRPTLKALVETLQAAVDAREGC